MNDEIIARNKIAYSILLVGFVCFFLTFYTGIVYLLLAFFTCSIVWFFMQDASRYCDYCGNYLQYVNQQFNIGNNVACKTCDKKYRNGKIGMNDTFYKSHIKTNGYGK